MLINLRLYIVKIYIMPMTVFEPGTSGFGNLSCYPLAYIKSWKYSWYRSSNPHMWLRNPFVLPTGHHQMSKKYNLNPGWNPQLVVSQSVCPTHWSTTNVKNSLNPGPCGLGNLLPHLLRHIKSKTCKIANSIKIGSIQCESAVLRKEIWEFEKLEI